mmetsp:Transcript_26206/g.64927  ORF Transcript_26206/g.64927 Transcript_26206/m.64927 type:complete len:215 (+) Transcript_26206:182-826(+)
MESSGFDLEHGRDRLNIGILDDKDGEKHVLLGAHKHFMLTGPHAEHLEPSLRPLHCFSAELRPLQQRKHMSSISRCVVGHSRPHHDPVAVDDQHSLHAMHEAQPLHGLVDQSLRAHVNVLPHRRVPVRLHRLPQRVGWRERPSARPSGRLLQVEATRRRAPHILERVVPLHLRPLVPCEVGVLLQHKLPPIAQWPTLGIVPSAVVGRGWLTERE